jgi:alcohol dehydrogenase class IV
MAKFDFHTVSRILFGRGQFARVGEIAAEFGRKAAVIINGPDQSSRRLFEKLAAAKVAHISIRQSGEPTAADVDRAVETARREECDLAIGIGGGSAIDAAKAVAGLVSNGGAALDYVEVVGKGQKFTRPAIPWIAIPCTAGTGAEVTRNAVIGLPDKHVKASLRSEHLLARVALVDPELAVHVRPEVTARTGMDALCQCIESYTSNGAQPITDALALEGIARATRSLQRAFTNGDDLDAREDMAIAAMLSGIALANAGLGAVHGFAAPLCANFPVPHGTVCAALLPGVMAANVQALRQLDPAHPILDRFATISRKMGASSDATDEDAIQSTIEFVESLRRDLQIPPLGKFGLSEADIPAQVALARKSSSMKFNPVTLSDGVLATILKDAIVYRVVV